MGEVDRLRQYALDTGEGPHNRARTISRGVEIAHTAENAEAQPSNLWSILAGVVSMCVASVHYMCAGVQCICESGIGVLYESHMQCM